RYRLIVTDGIRPPSPFTFTLTDATVAGITPGAMTSWAVSARGGNTLYLVSTLVKDSDNDGRVTYVFPFKTTIPPFGIWTVADLSTHTIVAGNPSGSVPERSPFPSKMFLRDGDGQYSHIQFSGFGSEPFTFTWTRPGAGAWKLALGYGGALDEDGLTNGRITFETSVMQAVDATSGPPPAGIAPGDMFVVIDGFGTAWSGDLVDDHLSETAGAGRVGFAIPTTSAKENSGSVKILVERTEGTDGTVTVQYSTADDTATAGRTYIAQAGTLTFGPGEIFKTIEVPLIDDHAYGGTRGFQVTLSNPAGVTLAVNTAEPVSVVDDELPPTLAFQSVSTSVPEGDDGLVDMPVTVKLTGATSLPVTARFSWTEGEFGASHLSVVEFAPGETQKTVVVSYAANTLPELDRKLAMSIFAPTNATIPVDRATITIVDDDFVGISVADASAVESAGTVTIPIQMSGVSRKQVTVTWETRNGTAFAGSDYVTRSGSITIDSNVTSGSNTRSISIPLLNDTSSESLETFEIVLTSVHGGKLDRATAAIAIVDDDAAVAPGPVPPRRRAAPH
ncbi:MAG TPA: Calx-beta domain-containing protein, partial [Thermoanaerobaculia bacterium]|nr:Calx-beta domain-containing protein [Thermoanaerobaculia bacterium]